MRVYLISSEINGGRLYKIGVTRREIASRIREMRTGNASEFRVVDSYSSPWGRKIEAGLHRAFVHRRVSGEWFDLADDDVVSFRRRCEAMHANFELLGESNEYFNRHFNKQK